MLNAKRNAFLDKMVFGERHTEGEPPPRAVDLLIDAAWMLGATAFMAAVILLAALAFGR